MARDFLGVLDQVIAAVPSEFVALRYQLIKMRSNARFCAPEAMWSHLGAKMEDLLANHIGQPIKPWHHEVSEIIRGGG